MRLGVLDVGSNTVHFLVVDAYHGAAPVPASSRKIELRLAEHLDPQDRIDDSGVDALVGFVRESVELAEDLGVTEVAAFATSAVRDATNSTQVIDAVRGRAGVELELLSGEEEARLTFLAVRRWFGWSAGRLLVLDIGGGSLEAAAGEDEAPEIALSLPLGAGRLTRGRFSSDPPSPAEVKELRKQVRAEIGTVVGMLGRGNRPRRVVATSKTFKQLARIAGAAPSSEGPFVARWLRRSDLHDWIPRLAEMTTAQRAQIPGVSIGRAPQLVAGALVAEAAMDLLGVDEVQVAPWALREGVILSRLDRMREEAGASGG